MPIPGPGVPLLTVDDLSPFATIDPVKAQAMIDDALAMAARAAPCILEDTFTGQAALKAILRGAVIRWNDSGSGAMQSQTAGPFGVTLDTRQQRRGMFWPSEIDALRDLCQGAETSGAFSVDTTPTGSAHLPWCNINFGATYCSCGVDIAEYPIFELGGYP